MSERERWIVYPLLFLALGASLRDKLAKQTRSKQIVCEELYVVDEEGIPLAKLAEGSLVLSGEGDKPGTLVAQRVQADSIMQGGRPIDEVVSWGKLLQMFQRLGLVQVPPNRPTTQEGPRLIPPSAE